MPTLKLKSRTISDEHQEVHDQLVALLKPYSKYLKLERDLREYALFTKLGFRTKTFHPENKTGILFAGISIRKHHVGFYFGPLDVDKKLADSLAPDLLQHRHGSYTFHFHSAIPENTQNAISEILKLGWEFFYTRRWVEDRIQ